MTQRRRQQQQSPRRWSQNGGGRIHTMLLLWLMMMYTVCYSYCSVMIRPVESWTNMVPLQATNAHLKRINILTQNGRHHQQRLRTTTTTTSTSVWYRMKQRQSIIYLHKPAFHSDATMNDSNNNNNSSVVVHNSNGDSEMNRPRPNGVVVMMVMAAAAAAVTVLLSSSLSLPIGGVASAVSTSSSTTTTIITNNDPLEHIRLGVGRWQPKSALSKSPLQQQQQSARGSYSSSSSSTRYSYSPSFCTYAARFLIQYDPDVNTWWTQQQQQPASDDHSHQSIQARQVLRDEFGSFSKTLECSFADIPPTVLFDRFMETYDDGHDNNPDVARQIAILFTLLPTHQQPTAQLDNWYNKHHQRQLSKQQWTTVSPDAAVVDTWQQQPLDGMELLPLEKFHIRRVRQQPSSTTTITSSTMEFVIHPPLPLYDNEMLTSANDATSTTTTIMTLFGPMASTSLVRGIPRYSWTTYASLGIAGAASCAITHAVVIPLDVVKTRAQTDPDQIENSKNTVAMSSGNNNASIGMLRSSLNIIEREGLEALLLGAQATILGYFWYGLSVYPTYAFTKRLLSQTIFSAAYTMSHENEIALLGGACAAVVASFGLAPIEAARIRVVADPMTYRPLGVTGTLSVIATENPTLGWMNLYASLPSLLIRQVIFGSTKFLIFERACEFLYTVEPQLHDRAWTCLAVTIVAGGLSGVVSSIISQPADSVLTYISKDKRTASDKDTSLIDILIRMNSEGGINAFFRGLRSRCLWAGSIIAGQFFLYDVFRTWFGVSSADLTQYYQLVVPQLT